MLYPPPNNATAIQQENQRSTAVPLPQREDNMPSCLAVKIPEPDAPVSATLVPTTTTPIHTHLSYLFTMPQANKCQSTRHRKRCRTQNTDRGIPRNVAKYGATQCLKIKTGQKKKIKKEKRKKKKRKQETKKLARMNKQWHIHPPISAAQVLLTFPVHTAPPAPLMHCTKMGLSPERSYVRLASINGFSGV